MQFILQIFTGAYFSQPVGMAAGQICQRLREVMELIDVSDVILGWNTDATLNRVVLDDIHDHGKKAWLWLPVFSEVPSIMKSEPQIGFSGTSYNAAPVAEEDFTFVCPTSPHNQRIPLALYDRFFQHLPFDGVFLDKIRHGGFAGGLEQGIGCACERCRDRYLDAGIQLDAMIIRVRKNPACLLPVARDGIRYQFIDPDVNRYLTAKAGIITEAVSFLAAEFRKGGLMIGLDVFAPLLSWYVGQDVYSLAEIADFVKPMLYLRTNAPAGIPFELAAMNDAMGGEPRRTLHALWGVGEKDSTGCAKAQIKTLSRTKCAVFPGFEINRVPGVCDSDPDYVCAMARQYADIGMQKVILSWNLLGDIGENIRALLE